MTGKGRKKMSHIRQIRKIMPVAAAAGILVSLETFAGAAERSFDAKALVPVKKLAMPDGGPMAFAKDGKCDFRIAFNARNHLERRAANMLAKCFERIVGERPGTNGTYAITFAADDTAEPEDFTVRTSPEGVALLGHPWHAALDFAERILGVRWYFPRTGEIYPKAKDLTIDPVAYSDAPYFPWRPEKWPTHCSVKNPGLVDKWQKYMPDLTRDEAYRFPDYWREGGSLPPCGSHSPNPLTLAKNHSNELDTIFYRSPKGKFYYNPKGHIGNYFDVLNLDFAELLIRDWKDFYASKGKIDRGNYKNFCNDTYVSFGCCDTKMPLSDVIDHPTVKELGLITQADIDRDPHHAMRNVYGHFYNYLGKRIKEEFPGKKLVVLAYYDSQLAPVDPRYPIPENVEINLCSGNLPYGLGNAERKENVLRDFREWYEARGNRPAFKAWLYAGVADKLRRAVGPEFAGDVPKTLGKYMGRGGVFYDYTGGEDLWHYFYSVYCCWRSQWNPAFDPDAAVEEMMHDLFPGEAGTWMAKFHSDLKQMVRERIATGAMAYPPEALDELERDLAEAKARLSDDSVVRARYALIADYFPAAFQTQRAKASYKPPVYEMRRRPGDAKGWDSLKPMKMLNTRTGGSSKLPVDVRLAWDDKGVYGHVRGSYVPAADSEKDMWSNDSVEVFFSPGTGKEVMYQFAFDVLDRTYVGKQRRLPILQPRDTTFKGEGFTHKTRIGGGGWEAGFFIPWTVFEAKPPKTGESWNANVVVNRHSEPEETASTSFTLNNNSNMGMFGLLRFNGD